MAFLNFHTTTQVGDHEPKIIKPRLGLNLYQFFDKVLKFGTIALAFLVPITYFWGTSEFYEFNKQLLLVSATVILGIAWLGKMWSARELRLVRTPLDLAVLIFVAVYLISTVTSINLLVSSLGHYGRFNGGLVSVLCYAALYFIYVNNVRTLEHVKNVAIAFVASGTFLAFYGILQYFGIYTLMTDYAKNRFFTPAGSPDVLSYLLVSLIPISMALIAISKNFTLKVVLALATIVQFAYVALVNVQAAQTSIPVGILLAALAILAFLYFARDTAFGKNRSIFVLLVVVLALLSTLVFPMVRNVLPSGLRDLPKEVNLDWGSSWQITATTLGKYPVIGSGPDTFLFDFTRFRDSSLNSTGYWNLRFDRANSELLQITATLGLLGLAAFLFLIYKVGRIALFYILKERELTAHTLAVGFGSGVLSLLLMAVLFGHFATTTAFMFWVSLAMLIRLLVEDNQVVVKSTVIRVPYGTDSADSRSDILPAMFFYPAIIIGAVALFIFGHIFAAETSFQDSLTAARANNGKATYDAQVTSIKNSQIGFSSLQLRLDRDIYHSVFSNTNLLLANSLSTQSNPDKNTLQGLVSQAVSESRTAKDINPYNVNNWEQVATVYRSLVNVVNGSDQFAEQAYIQAIQLDPQNPRLRDALGNFYSQVKRYDDSINVLVAAVQLKPDLAAAHFDLARALVARTGVDGTTNDKKRDYLTSAQSQYQATLQLVASGSSDEKQINQELDNVNKQLSALGGPASQTSIQAPSAPKTATSPASKK
jgi:tetratricopeptide (TPR) repeat protein